MSDFRDYLQQLTDPAFATEYEAMRPECEAIHAVIAARLKSHMTQKALAEKTGIWQSKYQPHRKRRSQSHDKHPFPHCCRNG